MSGTHAHTVNFVRDTMLPPVDPPPGQGGAIKWLRDNLFAGPFNTALTLIAIYVVYLVLQGIVPWLMNSVWNAGSLRECRETVAAIGEGATGACWAVIRERWHQYMFGFYPPDLYWRPMLAFTLLFVALAPVLYYGNQRSALGITGTAGVLLVLALLGLGTAGLPLVASAAIMAALAAVAYVAPKRLIWVTVFYAPLCFYLLWGGTIWRPVAAVFGFVILAGVFRLAQGRFGSVGGAAIGVIAALFWWIYLDAVVVDALASVVAGALTPVSSDQFGGFLLAITIGVTAISFSLPIGIILALGRQSNMMIVKTLSVGFIEFIRGVPLITLLFTASLLLQYFLPPGTNFDIILRVIILVTLFAAAYLAEVIRGGLAALPKGQYEAADALGLDYWQAQRLIILPQALKISIPGIVSTFIGLFKDTTLVSFVGLLDPLRGVTAAVRADINWKGIYWEPYVFVGATFFLMCYGMSRYSMYLERKLRTDHR